MTTSSMFCATVFKPTQCTPLGLRLWRAPPTAAAEGAILIVHIDDHGLFAKVLKPGMQIETINGHACTGCSATDIQAYLDELQGRVSIMATLPGLLQPCRLSTAAKSVAASSTAAKQRRSSSIMTPPPQLVDLEHLDGDDDDSSSSSLTECDYEYDNDVDYGYGDQDCDDDDRGDRPDESFLGAMVKMFI